MVVTKRKFRYPTIKNGTVEKSRCRFFMEKDNMCTQKRLVLAAPSLYSFASLGAVTHQDIEGMWACAPYTMTGKNMTITVTEQRNDGNAPLPPRGDAARVRSVDAICS